MELKSGSVIRSFDQEGLITKEPALRKLVGLFCHVDDFCTAFLPQRSRSSLRALSVSAILKNVCQKVK